LATYIVDVNLSTSIAEGPFPTFIVGSSFVDSAENKGCYPIAFADLKTECPELHGIIWRAIKHE